MTSINPHFTFEYSQPGEYRFSHDSVFLARKVFELIPADRIPRLRGLDLCAGCGIIGLDFIFHCQKEYGITPVQMDFVEIQDLYRSHFETNVQRLGPVTTSLFFRPENYADLVGIDPRGTYNLILCNPPYFFPNQGQLSPSTFKNRCRFYLDSDFPSLLRAIVHSLADDGEAYLLLRDRPEHRWNAIAETAKVLPPPTDLQVIGDIRGTQLLRIRQKSW